MGRRQVPGLGGDVSTASAAPVTCMPSVAAPRPPAAAGRCSAMATPPPGAAGTRPPAPAPASRSRAHRFGAATLGGVDDVFADATRQMSTSGTAVFTPAGGMLANPSGAIAVNFVARGLGAAEPGFSIGGLVFSGLNGSATASLPARLPATTARGFAPAARPSFRSPARSTAISPAAAPTGWSFRRSCDRPKRRVGRRAAVQAAPKPAATSACSRSACRSATSSRPIENRTRWPRRCGPRPAPRIACRS